MRLYENWFGVIPQDEEIIECSDCKECNEGEIHDIFPVIWCRTLVQFIDKEDWKISDTSFACQDYEKRL